MKLKSLIFSVVIVLSLQATAQIKKLQDQKAIKAMCGCYEVSFNFAETFNYSDDPEYKPSAVKHDSGLEWVELVTDEADKIVMQHLLIVGPEENQKVIKHWRQDWLFENTEFYTFDHDNRWTYTSLPKAEVKGQWTQKVFQVDDSPRYEGSATWVHVDGKSSWENTTDAPLPRREYTKRNDYNVTRRTNKHIITPTGWIHNQDNDKVIRKTGQSDILLAQEKGINVYTKIEDVKCQAAMKWWDSNRDKWVDVRYKWEEIFAQKQNLSLRTTVNEKPLHRYILAKDFEFTTDNISSTIEKFVIRK